MLEPLDLHLFNEGTHRRLWQTLGAHLGERDGVQGTHFAVWAPNAERVFVVGDFNHWSGDTAPLYPLGESGIWRGFVPGVARGALYKYRIHPRDSDLVAEKTDPFGLFQEVPPKTASVVWKLDYQWNDGAWMRDRHRHNSHRAPMAIYEMHVGSWMRVPEEGNRTLTYRELAPRLSEYLTRLGFTHVEFMPIMEHPFSGSWGYQSLGYFAATSRFGTPEDFMYLIDHLHQNGIGVILDWVPSHFPTDGHGLYRFDGTHLYEHADQRQGFHPDWKSAIFNYGRNEVRSFLTSSAMFWLDVFHADGLRVDAVASMLYLDYSRQDGEWLPNRHGGRENIEAIELLRQVNTACYAEHPDIQMIAEESTAWGGVSRPVEVGGLGFGMKWDMGWMHDTLKYIARDSIHRKHHHDELTFRAVYANHESFVLPLSHDEVVHGKGSLIGKMPGDDWQRFANLRLLYAYMWATPGKKLLFMGGEFAQWNEWRHDESLDWHLTPFERHSQVQQFVARLNLLYKEYPALYDLDYEYRGFEWVKLHDRDNSVLAFLRRGEGERDWLLCAFNFTPVARPEYRMGVPLPGPWQEVLNSDAEQFGGSGVVTSHARYAETQPHDGREQSLAITLPPLGAAYWRPV
jgi:1,4-alpha-glucan branching enzyme